MDGKQCKTKENIHNKEKKITYNIFIILMSLHP